MTLKYLVAAVAVFTASVAAHADTLNYSFTFESDPASLNTYANGSGTFSVTYGAGSSTGTISAFSLADRLSYGSSVNDFSYGLSDLSTDTVTLSPGSPEQLSTLNIQTKSVSGNDNGGTIPNPFGPAFATLTYTNGTFGASTGGVFNETTKSTQSTLTLVSFTPTSAPEVSEAGALSGLSLLLGCGMVLRERRRLRM